MLSRGDVVDVLFGDEDCIVLTSSTCLRLTAVPAAIVESLEEPRSEDELRQALEERFGPAPEGRLEEVLEELRSQGVVRVVSETASSDES